jgi:hypothetical protein
MLKPSYTLSLGQLFWVKMISLAKAKTRENLECK